MNVLKGISILLHFSGDESDELLFCAQGLLYLVIKILNILLEHLPPKNADICTYFL
jgi:hypothetical protein